MNFKKGATPFFSIWTIAHASKSRTLFGLLGANLRNRLPGWCQTVAWFVSIERESENRQ